MGNVTGETGNTIGSGDALHQSTAPEEKMKPENKKKYSAEPEPGYSITNMNGQRGPEHYSYLDMNGVTHSSSVYSYLDMNGKAGTDTRYSLLCMNGK